MIKAIRFFTFAAALLISSAAYAQDQVEASTEPAQEMAQNEGAGVDADIQQQDESEQPPQEELVTTEGIELLANKPQFNSADYNSLLFTFWEHTAIQDARRARGYARAPTEAELTRDLKTREDALERIKPPPEEREIRLSGILYNTGADWTIWLNEERVTPTAIPEEVMDLKVYKTYIEFKWFDEYTNQIFPIRLRPNQRFNIDTRIFLPG